MRELPKANPDVVVPSFEELRALGRDRLLNYFLFADESPPDDLDALALAGHDLLEREAPEEAAKWEEALRKQKRIPMEEVMRELGIELDTESPDESAA